jgi:hypothetical protein
VIPVDRLNSRKLEKALDENLRPEARQLVIDCREAAMKKILPLQEDFLREILTEQDA